MKVRHKGVLIYSERTETPNFDVRDNGTLRHRKSLVSTSYHYGRTLKSYPYDNIKEAKASVDNVLAQLKLIDAPKSVDMKEFALAMDA